MAVFHQSEESRQLPQSIFIFVVFSSYEPNPLEHFHSKGFPGDGAYHIHRVFLLTNVVSPDKQNVSSLVDIVIFLNSPRQSGKSFVEVGVKLVLESTLLSHLLLELPSLLGMGPLLVVSLLLEISPPLLLLSKFL